MRELTSRMRGGFTRPDKTPQGATNDTETHWRFAPTHSDAIKFKCTCQHITADLVNAPAGVMNAVSTLSTGLIASPSVSQTLTNSNYPNGQIRRAGLSLMARSSHKASRLHHTDVIYLALAESPQSPNCSASPCSNVLRLEASDY